MQRKDPAESNLGGRFTRRALLIGAAQAGLLSLVGQRFYDLQIVDSDRYRLLADKNRINMLPLAPRRARILDRNGQVLADNRDELGLALVPDLAGDIGRVLDRLAKLVEIPADERARLIEKAAGQSRILPIEIKVVLDWRQFARINVLAPQLPGIQTLIRPVRQYHFGEELGHIVGYTGRVDRYEIEGDPALFLPDMRIGKSGVEFGLDVQLRGRGGHVRREVDARGRIIRQLDHVASTPGRDVTLTIEKSLQEAIYRRVARERRAAVVAMHPVTGDVLAMASVPGYEPADLIDGISEREWARLQGAREKPLLDRAIRGQYPPGSTFKMVTALAALQSGVITPSTSFRCSGSYTLANHSFGCWRRGGHGAMNLHSGLRESCDVYFYRLAQRTGISRLAEMARILGFGQSFDFALARQKAGTVPTPGWKLGTLGEPWYDGETLLAGIGQGYVLTTPLQLAVMTARLASGRAVVPRLTPEATAQPRDLAPALEIDPAALEAIRRGMHAVVHERSGTARRARLADDDVQIAGKTGTAQVTSASRHISHDRLAYNKRDHSLFVGYAPFDRPRYAVAAIVEHGGAGSRVAAPLVRDVMQILFAHEARRTAGSEGKTEGLPLPRRMPGRGEAASRRRAGRDSSKTRQRG